MLLILQRREREEEGKYGYSTCKFRVGVTPPSTDDVDRSRQQKRPRLTLQNSACAPASFGNERAKTSIIRDDVAD